MPNIMARKPRGNAPGHRRLAAQIASTLLPLGKVKAEQVLNGLDDLLQAFLEPRDGNIPDDMFGIAAQMPKDPQGFKRVLDNMREEIARYEQDEAGPNWLQGVINNDNGNGG